MSPIVTQNTIDLSFLDENLSLVIDGTDCVFSLEEIEKIAQAQTYNTKLAENNGVGLGLPVSPRAVLVQPATPDALANSTQMLELEPVSPEMIVLQPVSPRHSVESLTLYSNEALSDGDVLPATTSELSSVQPASPDQYYVMPYSPEPSSLEAEVLHAALPTSVEAVMSPSEQIKEEDASGQLLDDTADVPKKRGRKRKYPEGAAPSSCRPKKLKIYEMGPMQDAKAEKKRINAINAKHHRDKQKNERNTLAQKLHAVTAERDSLQQENDSLRKQVEQLKQNAAQMQLILTKKEHQNEVVL